MDEWTSVQVVRARAVAEAVREFVLEPRDGARLRTWRAGAHLRLRARTVDGRPAERSYSLVGPADTSEACTIAVHRAHDHGVSAYLHDSVRVGDTFDVSQPLNDFALHTGPGRAVLIAGGIGITPLLPMARESLAAGRRFELRYAARSGQAMAYRSDVRALGEDNVQLYLGEKGQRLDLRQSALQWHGNDHVYVCGPRGMIDEVRAVAAWIKLPPAQVHFESFGPDIADGHIFMVELRRSRRELAVAAGQSVLNAMEEAGLYAPSDCLRGECGSCAVRVIDGEVDHRDFCLSQADRNIARLMTPCVSRAAGQRLVLDL